MMDSPITKTSTCVRTVVVGLSTVRYAILSLKKDVKIQMGARRIGIFMAIGLGFTLAGFVLRLIQPNDLNSQWDTEFLKVFVD